MANGVAFSLVCSSGTSRWTVLANGTLAIGGVRREDAGALWCGAVNEAGSLVGRTRLELVGVAAPPPVVVEVGPANQTLPLKSPATLLCQAEGQPVRWLKGNPFRYYQQTHKRRQVEMEKTL